MLARQIKLLRKLWQTELQPGRKSSSVIWSVSGPLRAQISKNSIHIRHTLPAFALRFIISSLLGKQLSLYKSDRLWRVQQWRSCSITCQRLLVQLSAPCGEIFIRSEWASTQRVCETSVYGEVFLQMQIKKSAKMTVQNYFNLSDILDLVIWVEDTSCIIHVSVTAAINPLPVFIYIIINYHYQFCTSKIMAVWWKKTNEYYSVCGVWSEGKRTQVLLVTFLLTDIFPFDDLRVNLTIIWSCYRWNSLKDEISWTSGREWRY